MSGEWRAWNRNCRTTPSYAQAIQVHRWDRAPDTDQNGLLQPTTSPEHGFPATSRQGFPAPARPGLSWVGFLGLTSCCQAALSRVAHQLSLSSSCISHLHEQFCGGGVYGIAES